METGTLSYLFQVPQEPKFDVGLGSRLSHKVSADLDMPRLLSGFTSIRKGAETPSNPEVFSQGAKLGALLISLLGRTHQEGIDLRVMEAFSISPAQLLQFPLLKDMRRKNQQKIGTNSQLLREDGAEDSVIIIPFNI